MRRIPYVFRTDRAVAGSLVNIGDINNVASVSGTCNWTQGGTLLDQLPQPPEGAHDWSIVAVNVSAYLGFAINMVGVSPFGKLGKIVTGLVPSAETPASSGNPLYAGVSPITQLPADQTLLADLWNPANDPLPPVSGSISYASISSGVLPVTGTISPPTPLQVVAESIPPKLGIWVLPSLLSHDGSHHCPILYVMAARAVIYYDVASR